MLRVWFCALLAMLGLPGCDRTALQQLQPGVSTAQDVRQWWGAPGMVWREADGGETWEYSRQPEGPQCFMVSLDSQGRVRQVEQVITPANLAKIQPGLSQEQVRRLLGQPRSVQFFALKQEEVWDWKVGKEITTDQFFNVHFNSNGYVVGTSSSVDMR